MNSKQTIKSFAMKSIIAAVAAIIITCTAVGFFSIQRIIANHTALTENTLISSVLAASKVGDGDIIRDFRHGDEDSEIFMRYKRSFERIAEEIGLEYVYVLQRNERGQYHFVFDTDPEEYTYIGEVYNVDDTGDLDETFKGEIIISKVYTDEWGTFMSAYAPIYDSTGDIVAIACVDYEISRFEEKLSVLIAHYVLICVLILFVIIAAFAVIIFMNYNGIKSRLTLIVTQLEDFSKNIAVSMNTFNNQSTALSNSSAESAGSISAVAGAAKNISSMIKSTGSDMQNAKNNFSEASNELASGTESMGQLAKSIQDIEESGEAIAGVTNTVNSIARKTKILALNAEVEATKVGEAGKSFAIVAYEVGSLALSVEAAAKDTRTIIERNKDYTAKAVEDTKNVQAMILSINGKLDNLTGIVSHVSEATEKQTGDVGQMLRDVSTVQNSVSENAASAQDIMSSANGLASIAESMKEQVEEIKNTIGEKI